MIDKDGLAVAHPDPLPAFRQLAEDCKRLDIQLVVAPVPDKGMLIGTAQNADFGKFRAAVEGYGATVLPLEKWMEAGDAPWYLRQDTHWTPRFMDRVARGMAESLKGKVWSAPAPLYRLRAATAESRGDLVGMLKLPVDQTLFGTERVAIDVVESLGDAGPAEVLLLGDSFTNIYSSPSLEWGQKAGLGEHLAYHLNAPVDVIAMNGAGATVRNELLRAARTGRLAPTRVLVYEFAIRDLYLEDWPVVELGNVERKLISRETKPAVVEAPVAVAEEKPVAPVAAPGVADSERVVLRGRIVQMSRAIQPGTAPYEDALIYGKVKVEQVVSGTYGKPEAIVVFLAMRKRVLLPGAGHKVGETVQLRLVRLKSAPEEIRSMQRSDDTEDFDLTPYFVEEELP
jgi:alginate O-acetyltransferase complex protein AlgJ